MSSLLPDSIWSDLNGLVRWDMQINIIKIRSLPAFERTLLSQPPLCLETDHPIKVWFF